MQRAAGQPHGAGSPSYLHWADTVGQLCLATGPTWEGGGGVCRGSGFGESLLQPSSTDSEHPSMWGRLLGSRDSEEKLPQALSTQSPSIRDHSGWKWSLNCPQPDTWA